MTDAEKVKALRGALKPFADAYGSPRIPVWANAIPSLPLGHGETNGTRWVTIDHWKNALVVMVATEG